VLPLGTGVEAGMNSLRTWGAGIWLAVLTAGAAVGDPQENPSVSAPEHQDLAGIHALTNGTLTVTWRQPGTTYDLYSGRRYSPSVTAEVSVRQGETLLFQHR